MKGSRILVGVCNLCSAYPLFFIDGIENNKSVSSLSALVLAITLLWVLLDGKLNLNPARFCINFRWHVALLCLLITHQFNIRGFLIGFDLFTFIIYVTLAVLFLHAIIEAKNE